MKRLTDYGFVSKPKSSRLAREESVEESESKKIHHQSLLTKKQDHSFQAHHSWLEMILVLHESWKSNPPSELFRPLVNYNYYTSGEMAQFDYIFTGVKVHVCHACMSCCHLDLE